MNSLDQEWEIVIGLEIHAELNTKSKLFSCAPNRFGDEPNTNITEVCTGQPGSLPVLNREAVRKAVQFGCAINATIAKVSSFDRKSYFYPDSPRNFQITQYAHPIVKGGVIIAEVNGEEMSFAVNRVHLEDDTGMLKHFSDFAGVDFNRAGVPLVEIVSEPCMRHPKEAVAYAQSVKAILQYIDASDCNMEEGSLRMDANVSVRKNGEKGLRNKVEIKNMNSFNHMEMALDSEIKRQIKAYENQPNTPFHEIIQQATYRWDPDRKETILMRTKEDAEDYRYFPEPDLVPIVLSEKYIEEIRQSLPELPLQRERRFVNQFGLTPHSAFVLIIDKRIADYFEECLTHCQNARALCNWITIEFAGRFKESKVDLVSSGILTLHVAKLINMIESGKITGRIAKSVADDMIVHVGKDPEQIVNENEDYHPLHDLHLIGQLVDEALKEHPQSIADYKAGKEKAFAFLVGQVMKRTRGKASPEIVNALLIQKIKDH